MGSERVDYYNNLVPAIYKNEIPEDFSLSPAGWALTDDVIKRPNIRATINGIETDIRPIGTMDVEFLDNTMVMAARKGEINLVKNYPCGLKCPGCFSEDAVFGDRDRLMTWQEVFAVIDDARTIGLTSIKFLGPGELFNNKDLFDILDACEERQLEFNVFTKGAELGDDDLARQHYGSLGINTARELVAQLAEYKTLRVLLGFNSFDHERQNKLVGSARTATNYEIQGNAFVSRGVPDYAEKRDRALQYLVEAGFNDPHYGQRLSLIATPLHLAQIDEIADMYIWAARRNMPLITAPTMESREKSVKLAMSNRSKDSDHQIMVDMFVSIYERAIAEGIMTKEQVRQQGISAYPGTAPCKQVANGLFLRLNGQIQMCPGRSSPDAVYGNVHEKSLAQIWMDSPNYSLGRKTNNWCTAKSNGLPFSIIPMIEERLGISARVEETAA